MTPEEQGTQNIRLLGRFLEHLLDHSEELDEVAGEIVLIPTDNSELAAANAVLRREVARATAVAHPAMMVGEATATDGPGPASASAPRPGLVETPPRPGEPS